MQPALGKPIADLHREVSRRVTNALRYFECGASTEFRGFFNLLIWLGKL